MVNALQTASEVVVQNSVREGFGLTLTEAMWKSVPCVASGSACGLRQQLRDGVDGIFIKNAQDSNEVCTALSRMLELDEEEREGLAINAKKRVGDNFLVYTQCRKYTTLLNTFSPHQQVQIQ